MRVTQQELYEKSGAELHLARSSVILHLRQARGEEEKILGDFSLGVGEVELLLYPLKAVRVFINRDGDKPRAGGLVVHLLAH